LNQRVVLQQNLDPTAGLVNGSQGTVVKFERYSAKRMPKTVPNREKQESLDRKNKRAESPGPTGPTSDSSPTIVGSHAQHREDQIQAFANANKNCSWPVVRFDNGQTRTIYADCTVSELGNEEPHSLLSRTQIPLMAGYAITVHKSQVCRSLERCRCIALC
jgi:ATP-dependent DNA helicase PIF1